ncbi:hypothetical protein BDY24DRAFT_442570 [Mrakia frigida]|uniref:uncharacterized protein n=1 Tax=Mrakia frigida TaxID=29902 RepID=UPI003FCBF8C5
MLKLIVASDSLALQHVLSSLPSSHSSTHPVFVHLRKIIQTPVTSTSTASTSIQKKKPSRGTMAYYNSAECRALYTPLRIQGFIVHELARSAVRLHQRTAKVLARIDAEMERMRR